MWTCSSTRVTLAWPSRITTSSSGTSRRHRPHRSGEAMSAQQPRRLARRAFLRAGALAFAGLAVPRPARGAGRVEIRMRSDAQGAHVWFDPVGILVEPGQTVRWVVDTEGASHTTTAYHPRNGDHSLRIPEAARP